MEYRTYHCLGLKETTFITELSGDEIMSFDTLTMFGMIASILSAGFVIALVVSNNSTN